MSWRNAHRIREDHDWDFQRIFTDALVIFERRQKERKK
jgi:hypothetical protein